MMAKQSAWIEFVILWGTGTCAILVESLFVGNPAPPALSPLFERLQPPALLSHYLGVAGLIFGLAMAVGVGLLAAHQVGLGAPIIEKKLRGESIGPDLRATLLPGLVVGVLLAGLWSLPRFPIVHRDKDASIRIQEQLEHSSAMKELAEQNSSVPITRTAGFILRAASAIDGELILRLFGLSLTACLIARIAGVPRGATNVNLLRLSVLAFAVALALYDFYGVWSANRWLRNLLVGVQIPVDPLWVTATHVFIKAIPASLLLGWLYVRRGIETAILAALIANLLHEFLVFYVLFRFF